MASVWTSKIVSDILKAIDIKLEKFKTYILSVVKTYPVSPDQIPAESLPGSKFANEFLSARMVNAESVFADVGIMSTLTTKLVQSDLGERLTLTSNEGITAIVESVQTIDENVDNISIIDSPTPPETAPIEGKIWLDQGVDPVVQRRWRGASVPTTRDYSLTDTGTSVTIDNTKGDVSSILVSAPDATEVVAITYGTDDYNIAVGEVVELVPLSGSNTITTSTEALSVTREGSGWQTVNDTTDLEDDLSTALDEANGASDAVESLTTRVEEIAAIVLEPGVLTQTIKTTIFNDTGYTELSNQVIQTATDTTNLQTETISINGQLQRISNWHTYKDGVLTLGSTEEQYVDYVNEISPAGMKIKEGGTDGTELITVYQNKVTSPRFQVTDALIAGGTAIKVGTDNHVRWLKYGR